MNFKKLYETINKAKGLSEAIEDLDTVIAEQIEEYLPELKYDMDYEFKNNDDYLEDIVKDTPYKVYGTDYGNALMLDVKGRPDIDTDRLGIEADNRFYDKIQGDIGFFAQNLQEEYPNFITAGRMSGWWGLKDLASNIVLSEAGKQHLKELTKRYIDNAIQNEEYTEDELTASDVYDIIYEQKPVYDLLTEFDDSFEIAPEYLEQMNNLVADIDAQEKFMNEPEYWEEFKAEQSEDVE